MSAGVSGQARDVSHEGLRVFVYHRQVSFGDCDPAGIAFYPNFYRWFDEAVHALMNQIGWSWRRTAKEMGWLGLPCAQARADFIRPVTHDTLLCEGEEKRFVGVPHPDDPDRVRAIDAPEALQEALTRPR